MISLDHIFQSRKPPPKFNYSSDYCDTPIIIDNGSYQFRAGFSVNSSPILEFKNVIGKSKSKKEGIIVGDYIEDFSTQVRYAFDRNVVVNYEVQESVFDYAFDQLGLTSLSDHPIVINEPLCNPNICRQQMSELLFEGYNVPSVSYYIDGLASYAYNNPDYLESFATDSALILSFGYQTVHILCLINGRLESKLCRKINVGGSQLDALMSRLLQLKYPCHGNIIDLRVGEYLQRNYCRLALDYRKEMLKWKDPIYTSQHSIKIQLPFKKSDRFMTQEQLEEKKRLQSVRGKEIYQKRNQEKLVTAQENLSNLKDLLSVKDNTKQTLKSMGFDNHDEVMNEIKYLESTIENLQNKISGIDARPVKDQLEDRDKYDLLDISDDELDDEELKLKQKQRMMKAAAIRREQIRLMKELHRKKILAAVSKLEESRDEDFPLWVMNLRHRRQSLIDSRLKKRTNVSATSLIHPGGPSITPSVGIDERRQQKARKIRRLAAELNEDISTDTAKIMKRTVSRDFDSTTDEYSRTAGISGNYDEGSDDESDTEQKQLTQLEILLSQYDPEFSKDNNAQLKINLEEYYRIRMTTEILRVPEVLFQPYMIGYEDAGLDEVLHGLVSGEYLVHLPTQSAPQLQSNSSTTSSSSPPHLPLNEQLAEKVFLTGSLANLPNLPTRIFQSIRKSLLVSVPDPEIKIADNPHLDAWRGACKLAQHPQFESMGISKEAYEEMGHDYIQEHPLSNYFFAPLTDIMEYNE